MPTGFTLVALSVLILGISSEACDDRDKGTGCTIYNTKCICDYGCKSDFIFPNMDACKQALYARRSDICSRSKICLHGGTCLQIASNPRYKCLCEGTGYYGTRCELQCPRPGSHVDGPFPYECVVI